MRRALLLAALVLLAAGCTAVPSGSAGPLPPRVTDRRSTTGGPPPAPVVTNTPPAEAVPLPPRPVGVDWSSPADVAAAMLVALWTVDTTKDPSLYAAQVRASVYCSPNYGAELRRLRPGAPPDGTWTLWASHRATTTVAVAAAPESGGPVNTPAVAYVEDVATVTPVGRDGWNGQPQMWVEFVTLSRPSRTTGWLVSGVETAP